jgi:16S rRNA (guanine(527)-N(7))-methyltransferase RsmG
MPEPTEPAVLGAEVAAVSGLLRELLLPPGLLSLLIAHAKAVAADADRLGLVSERSVEEVLRRHTADSLLFALARAPEPDEVWVDVGSGAGFPGIALACCYPEARFVMLEPQLRRAGFLELQVTDLGLSNAEVVAARASDVDPVFDVATARALAEPLLALEALNGLVAGRGTVLLAVGDAVPTPAGVTDLDVRRPGVDSPGRIFMIAPTLGEA